MSATILPFPLVRRRDFVLRNAARIADASPSTAEKLLAHAVQVQVDTMARRGIADGWKHITSADAATAALQRAAEEKNNSTQATRRLASSKKPDALSYPDPDALAELRLAPSRTR